MSAASSPRSKNPIPQWVASPSTQPTSSSPPKEDPNEAVSKESKKAHKVKQPLTTTNTTSSRKTGRQVSIPPTHTSKFRSTPSTESKDATNAASGLNDPAKLVLAGNRKPVAESSRVDRSKSLLCLHKSAKQGSKRLKRGTRGV